MIGRFFRGIWQEYVIDLRDRLDAEAALYRSTTPPGEVSLRIAGVLLTVIGVLTFVRFAGNEHDTRWMVQGLRAVGLDDLAARLHDALNTSPDRRFHQRIVWAVARVTGYLVPTLLVARLVLRDPIRTLGLRVRGTARHMSVYALFFVVMAPVLYIASLSPAFQAKYPYYKLARGEALWPWLWGWEALYAAQFVALEFFYRGFFLHGLRRALGHASIFVMMVPYTMIHFGKPLPETLGSVLAGFILGTVSLKSGSIWGGCAIHVAVATSMDLLSLWHQGRL
ncbi:CPBP family glutamic-type intramembrane protease [Sorangium sp. So ce1024]|uniref:CPBP family glutamic-type intramembrane protease n=1 Tax=unclassified Sorangium TaxID=2621164 RepID=UPI003EFC1134